MRNIVFKSVFALVSALAIAQPAAADNYRVSVPNVPANLQVPDGNKPYLAGSAYGTQNYVCLPSATAPAGVAWTFFGPQATLFNDDSEQIVTHYLSPNPAENETPRATWRHSRDTSTVWAVAIANSTDPTYVAPGSIPWLLLQVVGSVEGPDGGSKLTGTTYIHRVGTLGGIAPAAGCAQSSDIGKKALVPYQTEYVFYKERP